MHPDRVSRTSLARLTDLPNVGPAMEKDLRLLGITEPLQLRGADPYALYEELCVRTGERQDPCVLDVLLSVTAFIGGEEPRPWWAFTAQRKAALAEREAG